MPPPQDRAPPSPSLQLTSAPSCAGSSPQPPLLPCFCPALPCRESWECPHISSVLPLGSVSVEGCLRSRASCWPVPCTCPLGSCHQRGCWVSQTPDVAQEAADQARETLGRCRDPEKKLLLTALPGAWVMGALRGNGAPSSARPIGEGLKLKGEVGSGSSAWASNLGHGECPSWAMSLTLFRA